MSSIVPWTTPGGSPCCCLQCDTEKISQWYQSVGLPIRYSSIEITSEEYAAIIAGSELIWAVVLNISGNSPTGKSIVEQNVEQLGSFTFQNCRASVGSGPTALNIQEVNGNIFTATVTTGFDIFVQNTGYGWPGEAPIVAPHLFFSGKNPTDGGGIGVFQYNSQNGDRKRWNNDGQLSASVFGKNVSFENYAQSSSTITTSVAIDFAAP